METKPFEERLAALKRDRIPEHIAIIMDGNGRWASERNLKRIDGHRAGVDTVRRIVRLAGRMGVGYLTLYTFSSENWGRPLGEIRGLMKLLAETLQLEIPELNKKKVRLTTIGDISILPPKSREALARAKEMTAGNNGLTLILALNYGGRDEIVRATRKIADKLANGELNPKDIKASLIEKHLDTAGFPDPDLLIRTSGEYRISNFLLWQLAYTELCVTDVLWPDFSENDLLGAVESYTRRERRFGKTSQQLMDIAKKVAATIVSPKDPS